jgi:hypothetical protein
MDYATLIRDAWETTWHNRFLWIFGLLGGAAAGSWSGVNFQRPASPATTPASLESSIEPINAWIALHPELVLSIVVGTVVILLTLGVVSFIAQGGLTEATVELAQHQPTSLGHAWRLGVHYFWRFFALSVLIAVVSVLVAAIVGAAAVAILGPAFFLGTIPTGVGLALAIALGIAALVVVIPLAIIISISVAFAQRSIVVEEVGATVALRHGWRLMREHLADSLLTWLIGLALSLATTIGVAVETAAVGGLLLLLGLALWAVVGATAVLVAYAALAIGLTILAFLVGEGIAGTFLWDYWTLAYLQLRGGAPGLPR